MSRKVISAGELRSELEQALDRDQCSVQYQPIVDLATGAIVAVEALCRWVHPRWGPISPSDFIPVAERSGLIVPLDRWMLQTACYQVKAWQLQFPVRPPLIVHVNLSAKRIHQATLIDEVRQVLVAADLKAACLRLEVTESVLMKDSIANVRTLHALRQLGVGIAIDDFGTGYSSLSYLRWLPADVLKLDRSFIARLGKDPRDTVIVQGIITIAKGLGMTLTAEGIETEDQYAQLRRLSCDRGQGYYFAQPLQPDDLTGLLQREALGGVIVGAGVTTPGTASGPRVLVIDDDEHLRRLTSCALEMEGYEVIAAADGLAALQVLEHDAPNVILLDLMMPVMDGRRFSQAYRERPGPHAPIIVLTAAGEAAVGAAEIGAASYLRKPFDLDALLKSVDRLVTPASG